MRAGEIMTLGADQLPHTANRRALPLGSIWFPALELARLAARGPRKSDLTFRIAITAAVARRLVAARSSRADGTTRHSTSGDATAFLPKVHSGETGASRDSGASKPVARPRLWR